MRTVMLVDAGLGRPPLSELRAAIEADEHPDVLALEDALGVTVLDEHAIVAVGGWRGHLLRRLPLPVAEAIEVLRRRHEIDLILTWGERLAFTVAALKLLTRLRVPHLAILFWVSPPKKAHLFGLAQRGIDRALLPSPAQRRFVLQSTSAPAERVPPILWGVDSRFWRPLGGPTDMICSVGREMRDYPTLVEALRGTGIPCHIAAGAHRDVTNPWLDRLNGVNLPPGVTLGRRSFPELRELYARSRFMVLPLLPSDNDNGTTAICEALATGTPVIVSATDGICEGFPPDLPFLRTVPCGDVAALRQAVLDWWQQPDLCAALGARREPGCAGTAVRTTGSAPSRPRPSPSPTPAPAPRRSLPVPPRLPDFGRGGWPSAPPAASTRIPRSARGYGRTMPEGHTIHRLAGALRQLSGRRVGASSPQGRFAEGAALLDGRVLEGAEALGKHLVVDFGDVNLHVHLGMAGSMFPSDPAGLPRPSVRLRLRAAEPPAVWDLVAPTRCELWSPDQVEALAARLGPDPLRGDDPDPAFSRIRASRRSIGELLLDQSVIAGVGNVFRAEVLHRCGLHPELAGSAVGDADLACVWETLRRLMARARDEGRIVTVEAPPGVDRSAIDPADGRYVYKQARCRSCGDHVRSWALGARTAYACETCQPRSPASR